LKQKLPIVGAVIYSAHRCKEGHQRPDSSVKITEDSNSANNNGKTSEVEADH